MQEEQEFVTDTQDAPAAGEVIRFPVDPEPFNLRLAMIGILVVTVIISYSLISALMQTSGFNLIGIFGAIVISALLLQVLEKPIKARWPRTRFLTITPQAIKVTHGDTVFREIDPRQQVNVYKWYFVVERRSRVPKGWHVVACALEQDDVYLPVYTLVDPKSFDTMRKQFTQLESKKRGNNNDLRLAGQQRRLHIAESARGLDGSEMTAEDFTSYLNALESQFPRWMPKNNA